MVPNLKIFAQSGVPYPITSKQAVELMNELPAIISDTLVNYDWTNAPADKSYVPPVARNMPDRLHRVKFVYYDYVYRPYVIATISNKKQESVAFTVRIDVKPLKLELSIFKAKRDLAKYREAYRIRMPRPTRKVSMEEAAESIFKQGERVEER